METQEEPKTERAIFRHPNAAVFIITVVTMLLFSLIIRVTPFGDNTILYDDMERQYIRYYAYLSSVLHGRGNILYSSGKSLGGSMLGFFAYYLTSPLDLLYALVPVEYYPEALTFISILRLGLLSLSANIFLRKIGLTNTVPFAISFGLCLWSFAGIINPLWVDDVIVFPLFMAAALKLSEDPRSVKSYLIFVLAAMCQIFVNYYLAYMIFLFLALFMIVRLALKRVSLRGAGEVFLGMNNALLLLSPLLVPLLKELLASEKTAGSGSFIAGLFTDLSVTDPLIVLSKLFSFAVDGEQVMFGMPHLFCGTVMIPLAIMFFLKKDIPVKERLETLILMIILLMSFCLSPLNLIWHMGKAPNGYPFRYAFLFAALMVVSAARAWNSRPLTKSDINKAFIPAAVLNLLITARCFLSPGLPWYSPKKAFTDLAILFLEYVLIRILCGEGRQALTCVASGLLFLLCIGDLTSNQYDMVRYAHRPSEKASVYRERYREKKMLVDEIQSKDKGIYRIEDIYSDPYDSLNDSLEYGYMGVSHYSTGDQRSVRQFLKAIGFNYNGLSDMYTNENTETCDSILNIKYLLTPQGIHENKTVFPTFVEAGCEMPEEMTEDSPFEFQEEMAAAFSGGDPGTRDKTEGGLFKPVYIISDAELPSGDPLIRIRELRIRTEGDGNLYFYIRKLRNTAQDMTVSLDGQDISGYANASAIKVLDLGRHEEGAECALRLTVRGDPDKADFGEPVMVTEDTGLLGKLASAAMSRGLLARQLSYSGFLIEKASAGRILISLPFEEGFTAKNTLTGEKYKVRPAFGGLMQIEVPESGDVELSYHVPGLETGMILMLSGAVLLCAVIFCLMKRKRD